MDDFLWRFKVKIGRNDKCWCGSGKKYKQCHMSFDNRIADYRNRGYQVPNHAMIRTEEQIEGIREAGKKNTMVLDYITPYVKEGITNIRLGMFLEIATTVGAVTGAFVAVWLNSSAIAVIFGCVLLLTAAMQQRRKSDHEGVRGSELARRLRLFGSWPQRDGTRKYYEVRNVGGGFSVMYVAGVLSGILGIGSGVLKVIAMDGLMKVPFKVSTTTSNFMMGVTACASAVVYVQRGNIVPTIAWPIMLGVLTGALLGARLLKRLDVSVLRRVFAIVIALVAINMIYNGLQGNF